jgi:leucyl-tRNA synthetase
MLMPFGFHCTGMPIYASAMKLKAGDEQVERMLKDMNVPDSDIELFKDPEHWVRYFPERAMKALRQLNLPGLDLTKSFVTTSINPYFNSFVEWQFVRLRKTGRIVFGRRPCIYSLKDAQPCAAHDRQTGEEATIVPLDQPVPEWIMKIEPADKREAYMAECVGGYPSERVISRSGNLCVVKSTEQWYIAYSDPVWKAQVTEYIRNGLIVHDPEVKENLLAAAENLHDWCCSREFGLGTRIPWDPRFVIDSLSDSTIYPIYYKFVDLLQYGDIYGSPSGPVPTVEFWDKVFSQEVTTDKRIQLFRSRIEAQDLRVSAKDLINNHLVMMIYNSIAIDRRLLPREYRVNGYVRVDGEKMSKSLGNFVTVEQAITSYPKNGLLIALLEAGDGLNDANIRLTDIPQIEKALASTLALPLKAPEVTFSPIIHASTEYAQVIVECWQQFLQAKAVGRNREALAYGWRKLAKSYTGKDKWLDYISVNIMRMALSPIIGCRYELPESEIAELLSHVKVDDHLPRINDYISSLRKLLTDKDVKAKIKIHHAILDHPGNPLRIISAFPNITIICDDTVLHPKRDPYKVKPIVL